MEEGGLGPSSFHGTTTSASHAFSEVCKWGVMNMGGYDKLPTQEISNYNPDKLRRFVNKTFDYRTSFFSKFDSRDVGRSRAIPKGVRKLWVADIILK